MASVNDIVNISQMASDIKASIDEQLKDKMEKINEVTERVDKLKSQLNDAVNKDLKSQQDRIKAKLAAETKKLDKMKQSVEDWTKEQLKTVEDWMTSQIESITAKEKELIAAEMSALQSCLQKRSESKTRMQAAQASSDEAS